MQRLPTRSFAAFLFDMDGTLLSSIAHAERHWSAWAARHSIDPVSFLHDMHGVRTIETVRRLVPHANAAAEAAWVVAAEIGDLAGVEAIAGAAAFLAALPAGRWTVVTSASRPLAEARLRHVGMTLPPDAVTAEDVAHGKPAPDCFLLGATRLGVAPADCLVFEDTAAGIAAAEAAGMQVAVLTATHRTALDTPHATLTDYAALDLAAAGRLMLRALEPKPSPQRMLGSR